MKKTFFSKALLLVAVALVGVAMATSCKKEIVSTENHGSIEPPDNIIDSLQNDSLQKPFLGTWVSRGMSSWGDPVCSPADLNSDTITFLPNHTMLDNCTGYGFNGFPYTIISDTTVEFGTWQYYVKFPSVDTLIIYNWRHCEDIASYIKNVIFTKINN